MSATFSTRPIAPFDALADIYDDVFTNSPIGRAQRNAVWEYADPLLKPGTRLLELNCGTGEDALHFSHRSMRVTACDSSSRMIDIAQQRMRQEPAAPVEFLVLPSEELSSLGTLPTFDAAFSNFSGLNCVADLGSVARSLASLLQDGSPALLCLSSRFCLSETLWFLLHGEPRRATRRWSGHTTARLESHIVDVWYPTIRNLQRAFAPWFQLRAVKGIGMFVPPSYLNDALLRRGIQIRALETADRTVARWPLFRSIGDHVLLHFERSAQ